MKIVRVPRQEQFTILPNHAVEDSRLSFRARGVLAYLLSRPDGWRTDAHRLAAGAAEGRYAILTALKELETAGYLKRTRTQDQRGHWATQCEVSDTPTEVQSPNAGSPDVGRLHSITRTDSNNPPTPHRRNAGSASPPRLSELEEADRCGHGAIVGRCAICREYEAI